MFVYARKDRAIPMVVDAPRRVHAAVGVGGKIICFLSLRGRLVPANDAFAAEVQQFQREYNNRKQLVESQKEAYLDVMRFNQHVSVVCAVPTVSTVFSTFNQDDDVCWVDLKFMKAFAIGERCDIDLR